MNPRFLLLSLSLWIATIGIPGGFSFMQTSIPTTTTRRNGILPPSKYHSSPFLFLASSSSSSSSSSSPSAAAATTTTTTEQQSLLAELRSKRVKELKDELTALQVSTTDVFEKEELVQRLYQAKQKQQEKQQQQQSTTSTTTNDNNNNNNNNNNINDTNQKNENKTTNTVSNNNNNNNIIRAPLYFTSLDRNLRVAAVNEDVGITVNPSEQPYATIQIEIGNRNGNGNNDDDATTLQLLLDTACSGFVLRPSVVDRYHHQLPKLQTPVTMTGAGGTAAAVATGLTQLQQFKIGGQTFGPLPAAVQDIGALPTSLDGIIGLSFLNQFAMTELDFQTGQVSFVKGKTNIPPPLPNNKNLQLVCQGDMSMVPSLGIFTTRVYLGGRGPVTMLVDTGAACTLLNWKGVQQLGLDRNNSKAITPLRAMGAMGSDNIAIRLTHRLHVSSTLHIGDMKNFVGLSLKEGNKRLAIDIGEIPIIDGLPGVGGILGVDALMRCRLVRIACQEPRQISLYN